jgi:hypothetical protein
MGTPSVRTDSLLPAMNLKTQYDIMEVPANVDLEGFRFPAKFLVTCPDDLKFKDSPESVKGIRVLYVGATKRFLSFQCYSDARTVVDELNRILDSDYSALGGRRG